MPTCTAETTFHHRHSRANTGDSMNCGPSLHMSVNADHEPGCAQPNIGRPRLVPAQGLKHGAGRVAARAARAAASTLIPWKLKQIGRALHRASKIARQIDANVEMHLPDKPPGMHCTRYHRLAERFEVQKHRPEGW